jgi:hypothetical protein
MNSLADTFRGDGAPQAVNTSEATTGFSRDPIRNG